MPFIGRPTLRDGRIDQQYPRTHENQAAVVAASADSLESRMLTVGARRADWVFIPL